MFFESGRHQFLPISHCREMTEPVFHDDVVVFVTPPTSQWFVVVTCEYVGHLIFSLHIERCTFLGIDISFLLELSVWCSCLWYYKVISLSLQPGLYSRSSMCTTSAATRVPSLEPSV